MISKCFLQTDGYEVLFNLKHLDTTKEYIDAVIEFLLEPHLSGVSVKSVPTFIAISDLQELIVYFEQHIAGLQQDPSYQSDTFVPRELSFQIKALSGDVISPTDGEFNILFMVNVGRRNEEASSTYVGAESAVTLENMQNFISLVRTVLNSVNQQVEREMGVRVFDTAMTHLSLESY